MIGFAIQIARGIVLKQKVKNRVIFSILILGVVSCSKHEEKNSTLEEAFQIHESSLSVAEDVEKILDEISPKDSTAIFLNERFENWRSTVVEVPGFEHDHDHDHDEEHHHHHHAPQINLTPEQILAIQKELQDSITAIKKEVMLYQQRASE